jgi:TolA-binding protein
LNSLILSRAVEPVQNTCRPLLHLKTRFLVVLAGLALCMIAGVAGCRMPGQSRPALDVGPSPVELKKYDDAVAVYLSAKYGEAAQAFDAIREQTNDPGVARMALYGLACSRLMTADDPQAYHDAVALWNAWVQCANKDNGPYRESPRLLAPVIQDKMLFSHIPLVAADASDGEVGQMVPRWLVVEANRELQKMKQRLTDEQLKSSNREKKIESLEKEIMRLKQQIKAFETIDQKIQKKKNAIPSAD